MKYALLDQDATRRATLRRTLEGRGLELGHDGTLDASAEDCRGSCGLVAVGDVGELQAFLDRQDPREDTLPVVLVARHGSLGDLVPLLHGSVYGLITFADGTDALTALLQDIAGDLSEQRLQLEAVDAARRYLALLRRSGATGLLRVQSEGESGQVLLRDGHVVDAEAGALRGVDAAAALVAKLAGAVELGWTDLQADGSAPVLELDPQDEDPALAVLSAEGQPLNDVSEGLIASMGPLRVLLADDDEALRGLYGKTLAHHGFKVCLAQDGKEALAKIETERPHVILSDVMMPRLDGWGLLAAVRDDHRLRETPFAFLSCHQDLMTQLERLDAGADAYLAKGAKLDEVVASLKRLVMPRLSLLAHIEPGVSLKGSFGRLGPVTMIRLLAQRNATGLLRVQDRWARFKLWFDSGVVAHVVATVAEAELQGEHALRSLIGAQRGCWVFEGGVEPDAWTLSRPAGALVEEIAVRANEEDRRVRERLVTGTQALVASEAWLRFYMTVCPPALLPVVEQVRQGASPREIIGSGTANPLVVDWLFKDMLAKGVVRFAETT